MQELTFEEFCAMPLKYVGGMSGDWGAHRAYRNSDLGIQQEVVTKRERHGDPYSGWKEGVVSFWLDRDPRQFANVAELYVAWMERVCGITDHSGDGNGKVGGEA